MWFAYFCLRPAANEALDPPKRLPLWVATLDRFLPSIATAVAILVVSGFILLLEIGIRVAPVGWLVMAAIGLVMTFIFGYVYLVLYPRLRTRCLASAWPEAPTTMNTIRWLVATNLILGLCTVVSAVVARYY
ncbi:CopD family protein [Geothrix limicola]|uniref:CopD family protein n=1 Tax=Geothrix limicola TaxID=2927978 RepID=UPI003B75B9C0